MSVNGEFHRLLKNCVAYLEASGASDADHWIARLQHAADRSDESLDAAAGEALDLLAAATARAPRFAEAREREEFGELAGHLAAICRAVVGRPANDEGNA